MRRILTAITVTLSSAVVVSSAFAEQITADLVKVSTPVYTPEYSEFSPALGTYSYDVSWQGIPAAEATIHVARDDGRYRVVVQARTYSGIDIFYKLRYRAEGLISATDFSPEKLVVDHQENSRFKNEQVVFDEKGEIFAIRSQRGKSEVKTLRFTPDNFTLEPLSAAFLARSLDWKVGQSRDFDIFNGKSRYLITLTAEEKVSIKIEGEKREVFVIVPSVKNLTDPGNEKKLHEAKIYVTADGSRDIVKIVSSVFIGSVTTELQEFVPETPAPVVLARAQLGKKAFVK